MVESGSPVYGIVNCKVIDDMSDGSNNRVLRRDVPDKPPTSPFHPYKLTVTDFPEGRASLMVSIV